MTPQLQTRYVFTITARIGEVTSAGEIGSGVRRIIPIIGGDVKGEGINGKVCAFGADFQIIRPNELIELEAKYAFETDDGAVVYVENKGLRFGPVELLQKLKRGEPVDPKLIYFRTVPRFETGARKVPLADGKPLHRLRRPPRRPRRHRRASGAVSLRHCERSEAIHVSASGAMDCVAALAMTKCGAACDITTRRANHS